MMQIQKPKYGFKYVKTIFDIFEQVPEDWEVHSLNDFAKEINIRFSKDKQGPILSVTKHRGFVKSLDFFKKQIFSKDVKKYKMVERGDFAYATIHLEEGSLGLLREFELGYISPMYTVFRINSTVNPDYLYHLLKTDSYLQKYSAMGEGTVNRRKSISFESFCKLKIPLPILNEQTKITSILSNVDSLIQLTQKEIDQTQMLKKGLMQRLLTKGIGHTRFKKVKSLFGKYEEIPEDWEYGKLSDLAEKEKDIVAGPFGSNLMVNDYRSEGVPIIRLQNIERNVFLNKNIQFITKEKAEELKYHSYQPDDLVLAKLGDPIGKTCRIPKNFPAGIVVADVVRIRISSKKCDSSFVEYVLNSEICERQLNKERIGTTRPRVNLEQIRNLSFPTPPKPEQQKIASILSTVDSQIQKQQEYKSKLETLKKGLMQKLLTGQIRVKV